MHDFNWTSLIKLGSVFVQKCATDPLHLLPSCLPFSWVYMEVITPWATSKLNRLSDLLTSLQAAASPFQISQVSKSHWTTDGWKLLLQEIRYVLHCCVFLWHRCWPLMGTGCWARWTFDSMWRGHSYSLHREDSLWAAFPRPRESAQKDYFSWKEPSLYKNWLSLVELGWEGNTEERCFLKRGRGSFNPSALWSSG